MNRSLSTFLLIAPLLVAIAPKVSASTPLGNDAHISGVIATPGQTDAYTFTASAGESVVLALVDSSDSLNPRLIIDDPDGINLFDFAHGVGALWRQTLAKTGTYTVSVEAGAAQTGTYELRYVRAPGANEHGILPNDAHVIEPISLGDLDTYTFSANAGESVVLSLVDSSATLNVALDVYDPNGAQIFFDSHGNGIIRTLALSQTGTHTVVVNANLPQTGVADLYFVRAPGANENGALIDEATVVTDLEMGDLDSYYFDASVGDNVVLTLEDVSATLNVNLEIFRPDGSLLFDAGHGAAVSFSQEIASTGRYVVVVHGTPLQTGTYSLFYSTDSELPAPVPSASPIAVACVLLLVACFTLGNRNRRAVFIRSDRTASAR